MSGTDVAMLRTCCLILCLVAVSRQLSITEFTVPESVEAGQDAELQCRFDLKANETEKDLFVKWWWTPLPETAVKVHLYQRKAGYAGETNQHNIKIKDNDTIVLLNVLPANSGTYECEVWSIDEVRKHQELIVFKVGSPPQLNISTVEDGPDEDEAEDVRIECEAQDVYPLPDLAVTINGKDIDITETVFGPDASGLYSVFANTTCSKGEAEGAQIRCELFFTQYNVTHQPYIDLELYKPLGDDGSILQYSRVLIAAGVVFIQLRNLA